ncbi:MAG: EAL and GGDEF domain-containing protein [Guyparkeria sp.]
MSEIRRLIQLGMVLTILTMVAIVIGAFLLYQEAFKAERQSLEDILSTQAALIEAVAAFDRVTNPDWQGDVPGIFAHGPEAATLSQIDSAFAATPGLGRTGELVLGHRGDDDEIVILLHQRKDVPGGRGPASEAERRKYAYAINESTSAAEPMRRALAGQSGTVIGEDYLNEIVLAAYQPLENLGWGLVAKKDLAEIRAPFIRSATVAALLGAALVLIGGVLFRRASDPLINRLRRSEARYAQLLEQAAEGVVVLDADDRVAIVNTKAAEIFGVSPQEAIGRCVQELIPADLNRRIVQARAARESGQTERYEYSLHRGDEELRLRISASPLIGPLGEYEGRMAVAADITPEYRERQAHERERRLLQTVLENLPAGVAVADEQGMILLGNPADASIWGGSRLGRKARDYRQWARWADSGKSAVDESEWPMDRALAPPHESTLDRIVEIEDAQGQAHTLMISAAPIINAGECWGAVELSQDITAERAMQKDMHRLSQAVEAAGEVVLVLDASGRIEYANPAFAGITGYSVEEVRGETMEHLLDAGRQPETFYRDLWERLCRDERVRRVVVNRRRDGRLFYWDMTLSPLTDGSGELFNVVVTARDITEQLDAEEALYRATREDLLTGLANDLAFRESLADRLKRIERSARGMALALVDLRGFSHFNRALGWSMGDAILKEHAERIRGMGREGDLVARLGADTFAILFADLRRDEDLPWVIEKLERSLDLAYTPGEDVSVVVPHYIGVARAPSDAQEADQLLACAYAALDAAKGDPLSNLRYYAPDFGQRAVRQISLEGALRKALASDALELYFQPQVDLATGRLRSAETLLRWNDPSLGTISPSEFIPVAERAGLIAAIDDWVLEHAVAILAEWRRMHRFDGRLALNVSGGRIADPDLPGKVAEELERVGCVPADLEIEVTETAAMQGSQVEQRNLAALREMGVSVAIDDFGTGYSSMAQLVRLPADVLKIDQSFVSGLGRDKTAAAVVKTILSLAHSMDLVVIAEGIETREQLAFLAEEGCEFGQGFLLARPLPASDMQSQLGRANWLPGEADD